MLTLPPCGGCGKILKNYPTQDLWISPIGSTKICEDCLEFILTMLPPLRMVVEQKIAKVRKQTGSSWWREPIESVPRKFILLTRPKRQ